MRRKKVQFHFSDETGLCICTINIRENQYIGMAQCHPDDMDMMSEKTGEEIAYNRAIVEMLRDERSRLQTELAGLKSLYYSMNNSPKFNAHSYEAISLFKQMRLRQDDIGSINDLIRSTQHYVDQLIKEKDEFYKKIRKNRKTEK